MTAYVSPAFRRIYVWEFPVRLYHWLNAIAVVVLIVTGFFIGQPFRMGVAYEAYQQYWFGTIRAVHFITAYIYFFNFAFRIYWGFVGNEYARWNNFIPTRRSQWAELGNVFSTDIFQTRLKGKISIGHNTLAGLVYFLSFLVFMFQAVTGFALYASMSNAWFPQLFGWVVPLMGGDPTVRLWHHASMWFFILFVVVHVYIVAYHDYVEGRGTTSSMMGGWKFEREDVLRGS